MKNKEYFKSVLRDPFPLSQMFKSLICGIIGCKETAPYYFKSEGAWPRCNRCKIVLVRANDWSNVEL